MVKLDDGRIAWFVREAVKGRETPRAWAPRLGVTVRRLQQLVQAYRRTGVPPTLKTNRRPKGPALTIQDQQWIERAREATRRGATKLWLWLRRQGVRIPKHKIHAYARARKWATPNPKKQKKRNRTRYERDHTGSLLHGDWHRTSLDHPHAILWIDDASRYALTGGEYDEESGAMSLATFDAARHEMAAWGLRIRDVNTDRGSPFYANEQEGKRPGWSQFEKHLAAHGIRHVPSRARNPQTNGKIERHWLEYDRHRWRFATLDDFLDWYNDQVHDELWIDDTIGIYETPREAFVRKLPVEVLMGLQARLAEPSLEPPTAEVIYAN